LDRDIDQIKVWIVKTRLQGWAVTDICVSVRVNREMFYRWWKRYQTLGWSGLEEKPKGRLSGPEIDKAIKDRVVRLCERCEWA
jgi:transposase-like protein